VLSKALGCNDDGQWIRNEMEQPMGTNKLKGRGSEEQRMENGEILVQDVYLREKMFCVLVAEVGSRPRLFLNIRYYLRLLLFSFSFVRRSVRCF